MKNKKLMMVAVSTICLLTAVKAATLLGPCRPAITSDYQSAFVPYVNLNFTGGLNFAKAPASDDWALCYESDKIYIYERWIKKSGGDSIRERKGFMIVNCDVAKAVKSITNYENQKNWMKNVEENKLIKRNSDTSWVTYTVFALPWPLDNRDVVSEYHLKEITPGTLVQIKINSLNNLIKETDGITRINNYNATWFIKKANTANVAISFCASSEPQHTIPAFILDPVMRKTFQKNLLNLRTILE
jgi:hypothetical protein